MKDLLENIYIFIYLFLSSHLKEMKEDNIK